MPRRIPSRTQPQLDFFPERVTVEPLDVRAVAGERTRVKAMFRVRYERETGSHQVFHDHHGWYCADHGTDCRAVGAARSRARTR